MDNHTAPELLEAVGLDWKEKYGQVRCPECALAQPTGVTFPSRHMYSCRRPSLLNVEVTYTGPGLGTPELDALLLVAGQRWLQNVTHSGKRDIAKNLHYDSFEEDSGGWISGRLGLMFQAQFPGHALARAIKEVQG